MGPEFESRHLHQISGYLFFCVVTKLSHIVYTPLELVLAVIERARNSDYKEWFLIPFAPPPLKAAISLYHKYGFEECFANYNNPMDDVIYM